MKLHLKVIIALLFLSTTASAKKIKSLFLGTVPIESDYLFASQTEVSNIQYKEFLAYVKKNKGIDAYWELFPDTTVWRNTLGYKEPFVNYYFQHHAFNDYPVVGISKEQANQYCNWLEHLMSENLPKGIEKIKIRLPTIKEWENAAKSGNTEFNLPMGINKYRMGKEDKKKNQGKHLYNYKRVNSIVKSSDYSSDGNIFTAPVKSYWPNDYGLYNMSGNVAEMVLDDTIAKGGSWNSSGHFLQIHVNDARTNSNTPSNTVGFRYFIEVVEYDRTPSKMDKRSKVSWAHRNISQIDSNLFACENECTNRAFRRFTLEHPKYTPQDSNWLLFGTKELFKKYSWHSEYSIHPVVNITFEAAKEYCIWLTNRYNKDPKRKFKKVKFRLPTEKEWEYAASGGKEVNVFPWGGPYVRNSRGSFLANYNPIGQQNLKDKNGKLDLKEINTHFFDNMEADGNKFTDWVGSYFPNDFGLYNCAGNVAEMLLEKGKAKGGSWGSMEEYIQIRYTVTKDTPYFYSRVYLPNSETSPFLGFRYFMEIIEW